MGFEGQLDHLLVGKRLGDKWVVYYPDVWKPREEFDGMRELEEDYPNEMWGSGPTVNDAYSNLKAKRLRKAFEGLNDEDEIIV